MTLLKRTLAAAVIAGGVASLAGPANAVPLGASAALRDAATPVVQTVQWRRFGWGGFGFGLAAGALIGTALASPYYYGGYAPAYYGYSYPAYSYSYPAYSYSYPAYSYSYAPSYYSYGYAPAYSGYAYSYPAYSYDSYAYYPRYRYRSAYRAWRW